MQTSKPVLNTMPLAPTAPTMAKAQAISFAQHSAHCSNNVQKLVNMLAVHTNKRRTVKHKVLKFIKSLCKLAC